MRQSESHRQMARCPPGSSEDVRMSLQHGVVIPAHPLALTASRQLDERRQRALSRYYLDCGAGGLAVGVHTTQFQIHSPEVGLLRPVLELAAEEMDRAASSAAASLIRVAGICGDSRQAVREAELARELGFHFGLVSLAALRGVSIDALVEHCRLVGEVLCVFGFYLQPKVGGVELPYEFWRRFCELENIAAIKVAAFDRYQTLTVVRAVAESGRRDIALYTGNDDNIVIDLLTTFEFSKTGERVSSQFVGGLLGQWAVWTSKAVVLLRNLREQRRTGNVAMEALRLSSQLTDANGAIFDAANSFRGCIPGIHEILRRQGLLSGTWCLDPNENLSPGQAAEIDRVLRDYPFLTDDDYVAGNLARWLSG